ncbi:hypothetical protein KA405_05090 [Patescibacteria group bacterium]|nr:hypothetical protein [Patescibacteria group bacterium]
MSGTGSFGSYSLPIVVRYERVTQLTTEVVGVERGSRRISHQTLRFLRTHVKGTVFSRSRSNLCTKCAIRPRLIDA